jgi:hypothetical protein
MRKNYNDPENWLSWLKVCAKDEGSPIRLPKSAWPSDRPLAVFGVITGQDRRALHAVAACWSLYAGSDDDGREAALSAIRLLLHGMQPQCWGFARELIAQSMDWSDRERLWPRVAGAQTKPSLADCLQDMHEAIAALPPCPGDWSGVSESCGRCGMHRNDHPAPRSAPPQSMIGGAALGSPRPGVYTWPLANPSKVTRHE